MILWNCIHIKHYTIFFHGDNFYNLNCRKCKQLKNIKTANNIITKVLKIVTKWKIFAKIYRVTLTRQTYKNNY